MANISSVVLHDSDGNAKRTMLIGTALLTTLETFKYKSLRQHTSEIRNAGFILAHLLTFAHSMTPCCRLNENGWRFKVQEIADTYHITVSGTPGIEKVLAEIQDMAPSKGSEEDKHEQFMMCKSDPDSYENCILSYKGRPREGGVLTSANYMAGRTVRQWDDWTWIFEVDSLPETCMCSSRY